MGRYVRGTLARAVRDGLTHCAHRLLALPSRWDTTPPDPTSGRGFEIRGRPALLVDLLSHYQEPRQLGGYLLSTALSSTDLTQA